MPATKFSKQRIESVQQQQQHYMRIQQKARTDWACNVCEMVSVCKHPSLAFFFFIDSSVPRFLLHPVGYPAWSVDE